MQIYLANPRGFCAGVDRAIAIVNKALIKHGAPIYVRHEVVHNKFVVNDLKQRGAVFVEELNEVPEAAVVIFSAHGVSKAVQQEALNRNLLVYDATCPLVTKVHIEVTRHARAGVDTLLIGHAGHPEVEGTMGQYEHGESGKIMLVENLNDVKNLNLTANQAVSYVTQTTLSIDDTAKIVAELKEKFPQLQGPKKDDICYATQNRQDAVKILAQKCQLVLVVGSPNSSNSNRLKELAEREGVKAYLIDDASEIEQNWLNNINAVGVTAGASAPEVLIDDVILKLRQWGGDAPQDIDGIQEHIVFSLPKALRQIE